MRPDLLNQVDGGVCVAPQARLEKEAERRLAQLAESAHDEAIVWVCLLSRLRPEPSEWL